MVSKELKRGGHAFWMGLGDKTEFVTGSLEFLEFQNGYLHAKSYNDSPELRKALNRAIALARKHVDSGVMASSAQLALSDAISLRDAGKAFFAFNRAQESLGYSIGILHADFQKFLEIRGENIPAITAFRNFKSPAQ